ncbi:MAG: FAD-dependent oxidoreductase [Fuerstiella sp.]|nr:FAD-dependent oxidoreductase [Fuerstiella sp.]MCP4855007.1 FAD-dependent oxidoreductase [Fuerstiella sp.]
MQSHSRVVVVGGGMMGVGLLYHLALEGWDDCVLLEKGELTSGSTWHAAGQCPSFIGNYSMAQIHHYSNLLYPELEKLTGQATGWHGCGGIRFATTREELDWFRYVEGISRNVGFRMQIISPEECQKINPFVDVTGVLAGAWTLDDGHVDPSGCCNAMAIGARKLGATIVRGNRVTNINSLPGGEWEVVTEQGNIICEHVVDAGGCYADRIGAWVGVDIPYINLRHQYIVTEPIKEFLDRDEEMPVIRDPYCSAYYRQEQKSGLIGVYETTGSREAWPYPGGQDWDAESELFPAELDPIMPWLERVMNRVPVFAEAGVVKVINGAIAHTPDDNPLVGPAAGLRNFWLCCGSSIGIAQGGGCGKYLAQWMVHGEAEINMASVDPRRFGSWADKEYSSAKGHEAYAEMYNLLLPGEERPAGRPARTSPMYERLKARGAVHTEAMGWERPKWFSPDGREEKCGFRHNNVFDVVAEECKAVRERVGVLELSSFSKYEVSGSDAAKFLNRECANKMPLRDGRIILAHLLTEHGRIENEFTVTRLNDNRFYLLSAAISELRDFDLLSHRIMETENVTVTNITDDWGVLVLAGPRSRDVLSQLTKTDLRNEQFRWLTAQTIEVAGIELRALRVNYVGELGWELHVPMNHLEPLYDAVWSAGESLGIADFGVYAVNSLRMEKAYRAYGSELTTEITMIDADMERFVAFEKEHFTGKEALLTRKAEGSNFHLVYAQVSTCDSDIRGGEPVLDGESVIGVATSGAYGHTVGKQLIFAYVKPVNGAPVSTFDIEILGKRHQCEVLSEPIVDPRNERLRS